jgi:hypothetical protein
MYHRAVTPMPGAFMSFTKPDVDLFYRLETSLHLPETRMSPQLVSDLLADDFLEFGKTGRVFNKQLTVDALAEERLSGSDSVPQVADFSVTSLSSDVVLVTYRSIRVADEALKSFETLRSSIWTLGSERWQMVFHQGTPIPQE